MSESTVFLLQEVLQQQCLRCQFFDRYLQGGIYPKSACRRIFLEIQTFLSAKPPATFLKSMSQFTFFFGKVLDCPLWRLVSRNAISMRGKCQYMDVCMNRLDEDSILLRTTSVSSIMVSINNFFCKKSFIIVRGKCPCIANLIYRHDRI